MSLNGILPVFKPRGISSFDIIRRLKRLLRVDKIGHGGTLDVMARGVLPVLYGEATKAFDYLLHSPKQYLARVQCGAFTDTDDQEGEIIQTITDYNFDRAALEAVLDRYRGTIEQAAPRYSALKVNGKRSSDLARANQEVPLKIRNVTIHSLTITDWDEQTRQFSMEVNCSSGTYIRSIARDLGQDMGWGGYLVDLLRQYSGSISHTDCYELDSFNADNIPTRLLSLERALEFLPGLDLAQSEDYIVQGRRLGPECFREAPSDFGTHRVLKEGRLLALIEVQSEKMSYLRVFRL